MSALLEAQFDFLADLALLLMEARRLGLPLKLGRGLCCENCAKPTSLHRESLAIDLPMIHHDGSYGTWDDYKPLGDFWKSLSPENAWGGDFDLNGDGIKKDDANHFSRRFEGHA